MGMISPPRLSNGARQFLHRSFARKRLNNRRRVLMTLPSRGPLRKADQISSGVGFEGRGLLASAVYGRERFVRSELPPRIEGSR